MTVSGSIDTSNLGAMQSIPRALPTELWLQVLENVRDPEYLWTTVRHVSLQHKAMIERIFTSTYLPVLSISLSLPRRDPTTGALRWPGVPIPKAQITMAFNRLSADRRHVVLVSPVILTDGANIKSVEELKNTSALSKERLEAAPAWVSMNKNSLAGLSMRLPMCIEWDEVQKIWVWQVEWRTFVTRFYEKKNKKRLSDAQKNSRANHTPRHGRR
ncbi:hypothetical protein P153DRAFT_380697 [Dothidotthia symphoricarpi CBS 119687]|uniref:F-box domain-containing protein n=1 Tax=Dothidotthia symphoricarpi CBS 119687 TaxID=1392245 RepID=A0A6A6AV99_9PLEO|nr:uncharacterized protein P153DRAFT_380697 [Dothidotthia symphoricarpi CBS 119687]KAF2134885.1 hypothetical protein P153DRAFT_380697 [Dothidotthia symphoricarpi CBS 119687]